MKILSKISCRLGGTFYGLLSGDFPRTVQIETTNACNARCIICPYTYMQRPVATMVDGLYAKLIDECARHNCPDVHLHNFGEPLLDPKLPERIRYAKEKGLKRVKLFSNGALLGPQKASEICNAGLDEIKISFDGTTKAEFEKIRFPLKFDRVVSNISELIRIRNRKKSPLKVIITCCATSDQSDTVSLLKRVGADEFSFGKMHNWSDGSTESDHRTPVRKPCTRIWRTFTVLSSGEATLCCLDYDGREILGDTNLQSIAEIWRSRRYRNLRRLHTAACQDRIDICSKCSKSFW
jgi:MoaA/NifB/PqqE/SkfB family radical SAM enzyme